MKRAIWSRATATALAGVAVSAGVLILAGRDPGPPAAAAPRAAPLPSPSEGRCPSLALQPLTPDAVARAALAALEQAPAIYKESKLARMHVTESVLARAEHSGRGGYARVKCGRRAQARTVVVKLSFPAMRPSASMSQGVVLVSRFAGDYRVWAQLH
jgi:hypothetical protein